MINNIPASRLVMPTKPLTDPRFEYRNAAATDVQTTWRRFGWQPLSKEKQDDKKKS
jgi:hypothetical protein